jgi:hypothetical protein
MLGEDQILSLVTWKCVVLWAMCIASTLHTYNTPIIHSNGDARQIRNTIIYPFIDIHTYSCAIYIGEPNNEKRFAWCGIPLLLVLLLLLLSLLSCFTYSFFLYIFPRKLNWMVKFVCVRCMYKHIQNVMGLFLCVVFNIEKHTKPTHTHSH